MLLLLVLGVLPSSGIIIIPRRYRRRRRPISSSARLFREIVRRRVFSLHRMIRVPHLFFFGIGRILSMKCLQPLRLLLSIAAAALNFARRIFSLCRPEEEEEEEEEEGLNEKNTREKVEIFSLSLCVCVRLCVFILLLLLSALSVFALPNLPRQNVLCLGSQCNTLNKRQLTLLCNTKKEEEEEEEEEEEDFSEQILR